MGVVDTLKDVTKLAQDIKNIPLYQQLVSLQTEIFELYDENHNLKEDVSKLREQLELRAKLLFENNFYWIIDGDLKDGPFCPKCYDDEREIRRMLMLDHLRGCPTCQLLLREDGNHPSVPDRNRFILILAKKPK